MSGIACPRALQAAGLPDRLIDKGLVFLGIKASRRAAVAGEGITFDRDVRSLDRSQVAESVAALGQEAVDTWYLPDGTSRCAARQLFFCRHYGMVSEVLNVTAEYCLDTIFQAPLIIFGSEVMNGNAISVYVLGQVQYKPRLTNLGQRCQKRKAYSWYQAVIEKAQRLKMHIEQRARRFDAKLFQIGLF